MFPRGSRLTGKNRFARVYQKGERRQGNYLIARLLPNREGRPRVSVVVSAAVSKKATERNRAKRVVRALLAPLALPPADLVVSVKRLPKEDDFNEFAKDLSRWFPPK